MPSIYTLPQVNKLPLLSLVIIVTVRDDFRRASVRVLGFGMSQYFTDLNSDEARPNLIITQAIDDIPLVHVLLTTLMGM